jgi:hypothetical protein
LPDGPEKPPDRILRGDSQGGAAFAAAARPYLPGAESVRPARCLALFRQCGIDAVRLEKPTLFKADHPFMKTFVRGRDKRKDQLIGKTITL